MRPAPHLRSQNSRKLASPNSEWRIQRMGLQTRQPQERHQFGGKAKNSQWFLKGSVNSPRSRRSIRILDLYPHSRRTGAIRAHGPSMHFSFFCTAKVRENTIHAPHRGRSTNKRGDALLMRRLRQVFGNPLESLARRNCVDRWLVRMKYLHSIEIIQNARFSVEHCARPCASQACATGASALTGD